MAFGELMPGALRRIGRSADASRLLDRLRTVAYTQPVQTASSMPGTEGHRWICRTISCMGSGVCGYIGGRGTGRDDSQVGRPGQTLKSPHFTTTAIQCLKEVDAFYTIQGSVRPVAVYAVRRPVGCVASPIACGCVRLRTSITWTYAATLRAGSSVGVVDAIGWASCEACVPRRRFDATDAWV